MPTYANWQQNPYQYAMEDWTTSTPEGDIQAISYSPGYLQELLALRQKIASGQATAWDREWYNMQVQAAQAVPMRDPSGLSYDAAQEGTGAYVSGGSPDLAHLMLTLAQKIEQGQATAQERSLFDTTYRSLADQNYRASVPQASDAQPFGLGDNLMGALMMIGMGASGGMAAAPLMAGGGLTLGTLGGLAGTAGGMAGMGGEALDEDWLRKAGIALGAAGGLAGAGNILSGGFNSLSDVLKFAKNIYGTGTKALGLAQGAGSTPDAPRPVGATSQTLGAGESRATGSGGGSMAGILDQLGPLLAGAVGAVGTGISLVDVNRYMEQLKARYGQQEETKQLIDEAYKLAQARYETFYAQSQEERQQKQTAYQDQLEKYQTHYGQTQTQYAQQQGAYTKGEAQLEQDRQAQIANYQTNRQQVDQSYARQVQEAAQERDFQLSQYGADRSLVLESYNRRVQEAQQDRQKEYQVFDTQFAKYQQDYDRRVAETAQDRAKQYGTFDTQFGRHLTREDQRAAQAAEERGLDLSAYQQRQAIGRNLSDPEAIAAGAQALYNPLSAAARDRVNVQTEEEMARRGVAGGGMMSNYMAAKAFAPQEAQLWQNAMQNYLSGQQGALTAYNQQDMTMAPEYRWAQLPQFSTSPEYRMQQVPDFSTSPEYRQMQVPNLVGTPAYNPYNIPDFSRTSASSVPAPPSWSAQSYPGAPNAERDYLQAPLPPSSYPEPYQPWGTTAATGGGAGGPLAGAGGIIEKLTQVLGGLSGGGGGDLSTYAGIAKMLAANIGKLGLDPSTQNAIQQELDAAMHNNDLYGFGGGGGAPSYDSSGWSYNPDTGTFDSGWGGYGGYEADYMNFDPWASTGYVPELPGADF